MKKFLFLSFVAIIALISCNNASAKEYGDVIVQTNDNEYRPGISVDVPTVLDFNAVWCGPCRALKPVFHDAARKYPNVKFVSIDVDNLPATASAFKVNAIPTVLLIKPDGTVTRYVGTEDLLPAEKFDNLVKNLLK